MRISLDLIMAGLKVFYDSFSQPSRAVLLLLQANKVPHDPVLINIAEMETRTREDFLKVTPQKQVPAIDDNGFCLFESSAILKYLVSKYKLPDHWYPKDEHMRAKVDEYLFWHNSNLRLGTGHLFFNKYIFPRMTGGSAPESRISDAEGMTKRSLKLLENYFLKDSEYIVGSQISIADLQAICELTQHWGVGSDLGEGNPHISEWMKRCQKDLEPHFDKVHKMVYMARDRQIFSKL